MKTFGQLTNDQKTQAVRRAIDLLIGLMVEGVIEVKMPHRINQEMLEEIITKHRKNETPHLAKEEIMKSVTLKPKIEHMAVKAAQGSRYDEHGFALMDLH